MQAKIRRFGHTHRLSILTDQLSGDPLVYEIKMKFNYFYCSEAKKEKKRNKTQRIKLITR